MTAELGRHQRGVGGDVHHPGIEVAHQAVPSVAEGRPHAGRLDPAGDARPGPLVLDVARHRPEVDAAAAERVGHLGQRAGAAVGEPGAGVERGMVHRLGRLQVEQQDGRARPLGHGDQHGGGHVGRQEPDDQVAVGHPQLLRGHGSLLRIGDEPHVDDLAVELREPLRDPARAGLQLRQQLGELGPVGTETARDQTDAGLARGDPAQTGDRGVAGVEGLAHLHAPSVRQGAGLSAGTRQPHQHPPARATRWCGSGRGRRARRPRWRCARGAPRA